MSEKTTHGPTQQEQAWRVHETKLELPRPLPDAIRPSRAELQSYPLEWELFLKPDLPQHGIYHGASVLIWSNVLFNMVPEDMRSRMDKTALSIASLYHDCGRKSDYGYLTGEMKKHGPRGADILKEQWQKVNPNLSEATVDQIEYLIRYHTPTNSDRAAKKVDTRKFEDYEDPHELELRILQDADHMDLVRGFYSRKIRRPRRTPLSALAAGARYAVHHISPGRNRTEAPGVIGGNLRFEETKQLYPLADALANMSRRDPQINQQYVADPLGATFEAAERLGILTK